jgi:hypothetical protein
VWGELKLSAATAVKAVAVCGSVTSSRRLEQRIREDLGFWYLAGTLTPDSLDAGISSGGSSEGVEW